MGISVTSRLRNWLNLTAISSVALLAATGGAVASSDLQLSGHDLDNFDTLAGVTYGVTSDRDVGSIINEGGASISTSIFGSIAGIYVEGTLGSLDNRGSISAVGVAAVYTLGLTTFNNSGDISFSHSGPMLAGPYAAVRIDGGPPSSFINSGTIESDYSGDIFGGDVGTFNFCGCFGGVAAINTS